MLDTFGEGDILIAGTAYDSNEPHANIQVRSAFANIKPRRRRKTTQVFSRYLYKSRNLFERFFNKLKHFKAVATL